MNIQYFFIYVTHHFLFPDNGLINPSLESNVQHRDFGTREFGTFYSYFYLDGEFKEHSNVINYKKYVNPVLSESYVQSLIVIITLLLKIICAFTDHGVSVSSIHHIKRKEKLTQRVSTYTMTLYLTTDFYEYL